MEPDSLATSVYATPAASNASLTYSPRPGMLGQYSSSYCDDIVRDTVLYGAQNVM